MKEYIKPSISLLDVIVESQLLDGTNGGDGGEGNKGDGGKEDIKPGTGDGLAKENSSWGGHRLGRMGLEEIIAISVKR